MPSVSQIIPSNLFSTQEVVINDNTAYTPAYPAEAGSVNTIAVYTSPEGEDGVLKTFDGGLSQFNEECGNGPVSLYGQPFLQARKMLETGCVTLHGLRVTAPNAGYARIHVYAQYKTDSNGLLIRYDAISGTNSLTDKAVLGEDGELGGSQIEGYSPVKLFSICMKGKGKYGNNYGFRIVSDAASDKDNVYKNYIFQILKNIDGTLVAYKGYNIVFNENAVINGNESLFVDSVINDPENGSDKLFIETNMAGFDTLYNAYANYVNEQPAQEGELLEPVPLSREEFDPLLGIDKNTRSAIRFLTIENGGIATSVILNSVTGVMLAGGTDGTFDEATLAETRTAAIETAYAAAWGGTVDPLIKSKYRYRADVIFDANYPADSKAAIAALAVIRRTPVVLDCGLDITTNSAVKQYFEANLRSSTNTYLVEIDGYAGKIRDPYNNKVVSLTATYALAQALPSQWRGNNYFKHIPFAGNTKGIIDGYFLKNSIYPIFDEALHADMMNELTELHINYARLNSRMRIIRSSQFTAQAKNSDLSEASNVFTVMDIARDCENLNSNYDYEFSEAEDLNRFNLDIELMILPKYADGVVSSIEARYEQNSWEATRGYLHLYIGVVHKKIVKTIITEIDVNRE